MASRDKITIPAVPAKFAGQWIAWDFDRQEIIANGKTIRRVEKAAQASGVSQIAYEWVPPTNVRIAGGVV